MRLFIAVEIPAQVQESLYQLKERIQFKKAKWPPPENLHLTLKFLGSCPQNKKAKIEKHLTQAVRNLSPSSFKLKGFGCFPSKKRARVFWVGVEEKEPCLENLYEKVEDAMEPLGLTKERRPFHSHITLARLKIPEDASLQLSDIDKDKEILPKTKIEIKNITLFESELTPQGAIYTSLAKIPLKKS